MYARESPWSDQELAACDRLHRCYGYCLWALYGKRSSWRRAAQSATSASLGKALLVAALLALFIPVHVQIGARLPLWYHLTFLIPLAPLVWAGARLGQRAVPG